MVSQPPSGQEYTFLDVFNHLWRRKLLIASIVVVITTATMALVSQIEPVYKAKTLILIEPQYSLASQELGRPSESVDKAFVSSQVEILKSRSLAREVIDELEIQVEDLKSQSFQQILAIHASKIFKWFIGEAPALDAIISPKRQAVDIFLDHLEVVQERDSNVVSVSVQLADPELASKVANRIGTEYLAAQLANKHDAAQQASRWLSNKLAMLRAELDDAHSRLARFAREDGEPDDVGEIVDGFEVANLRQELVEAGIDRQALETRYNRYVRLLREGQLEHGTDQLGATVLLQNLQSLKAELLRREAELSSQYGSKHPRILAIQAEKSELTSRIREEQQSLVDELGSKVEIAREKEERLERELARLKAGSSEQARRSIQQSEIEQDIQLKRELYQTYLAQYETLTNSEDTHRPDARVISEAVPPDQPSSPKVKLALVVSTSAATVIALLMTYVIELFDRGFRTGREVEQVLGLGVIAIVPELPKGKRRALEPQEVVLRHPRSRYSEALRHTLVALTAGMERNESRILLAASTLPAEGKSNLCLSLARLAALDGRRVLLIDGDLRRPMIGERLGLQSNPGFSDFLLGTSSVETAVHPDPETPLSIIAGGTAADRALGLVTSGRFEDLLLWARKRFELIILDSPPLSAVADAKIYVRQADILLYLIRWRRTPRSLVDRTLTDLRRLAPPPAAAILSRVDLKSHAKWAHQETGFGYPELRAYYPD